MEQQAVTSQYLRHLEKLTRPDKRTIDALTQVAKDAHGTHANEIVKAVEQRIATCTLEEQLAAWYLLDSIVKNVAGDYVRLFSAALPRLAADHMAITAETKTHYGTLLRTWKEMAIFGSEVFSKIKQEVTKKARHEAQAQAEGKKPAPAPVAPPAPPPRQTTHAPAGLFPTLPQQNAQQGETIYRPPVGPGQQPPSSSSRINTLPAPPPPPPADRGFVLPPPPAPTPGGYFGTPHSHQHQQHHQQQQHHQHHQHQQHHQHHHHHHNHYQQPQHGYSPYGMPPAPFVDRNEVRNLEEEGAALQRQIEMMKQSQLEQLDQENAELQQQVEQMKDNLKRPRVVVHIKKDKPSGKDDLPPPPPPIQSSNTIMRPIDQMYPPPRGMPFPPVPPMGPGGLWEPMQRGQPNQDDGSQALKPDMSHMGRILQEVQSEKMRLQQQQMLQGMDGMPVPPAPPQNQYGGPKAEMPAANAPVNQQKLNAEQHVLSHFSRRKEKPDESSSSSSDSDSDSSSSSSDSRSGTPIPGQDDQIGWTMNPDARKASGRRLQVCKHGPTCKFQDDPDHLNRFDHPWLTAQNAPMKDKKVFVGNLEIAVTEELLQQVYSQYGPLQEVVLLRQKQNTSTDRCAFIIFESPEAALAAVTGTNARPLPGMTQNIVTRFADRQARKGMPGYVEKEEDTAGGANGSAGGGGGDRRGGGGDRRGGGGGDRGGDRGGGRRYSEREPDAAALDEAFSNLPRREDDRKRRRDDSRDRKPRRDPGDSWGQMDASDWGTFGDDSHRRRSRDRPRDRDGGRNDGNRGGGGRDRDRQDRRGDYDDRRRRN